MLRSLCDGHVHLMQRIRCQQIIMIQQSDVVSGCTQDPCVGILRDPQIVFQGEIYDPRVLKAFCDPPQLICTGCIRKHQLPGGVCLIDQRPDHLPQKILRGPIQRHHDTESPAAVLFLPKLPLPAQGLRARRRRCGLTLRITLQSLRCCGYGGRQSVSLQIIYGFLQIGQAYFSHLLSMQKKTLPATAAGGRVSLLQIYSQKAYNSAFRSSVS